MRARVRDRPAASARRARRCARSAPRRPRRPARPAARAAGRAADRDAPAQRAARRAGALHLRADGRRDPFLNLLGTGADARATSRSGDGPAGMTVGEISRARHHAEPRRARRDDSGPDNGPTSCTRATSSSTARSRAHAAGTGRRSGSQRSAVARQAAGSPQAAAIARGRQGMTVTRGLALLLTRGRGRRARAASGRAAGSAADSRRRG